MRVNFYKKRARHIVLNYLICLDGYRLDFCVLPFEQPNILDYTATTVSRSSTTRKSRDITAWKNLLRKITMVTASLFYVAAALIVFGVLVGVAICCGRIAETRFGRK